MGIGQMANIPQVIITLSPQGSLIIELPAANGARRQIDLSGDCEATLKRILQAQLRERVEIGLDGAPTAAQVRHWERHGKWKDPQCRFCIAAGLNPNKAKPLSTAKLQKQQQDLIERANRAKREKDLDRELAAAGIVI
jgi:hypothetical protein